MHHRRWAAALALIVAACGSDRATGPSGRDLAGDWTGSMTRIGASSYVPATAALEMTLQAGSGRAVADVALYFPDRSPTHPEISAVDLEPTYFDVQFPLRDAGDIQSLHCVVQQSTARSCDGTVTYHTSGQTTVIYAIHMLR